MRMLKIVLKILGPTKAMFLFKLSQAIDDLKKKAVTVVPIRLLIVMKGDPTNKQTQPIGVKITQWKCDWSEMVRTLGTYSVRGLITEWNELSYAG